MPSRDFKCPDGETIRIETCLKNGGCRMGKRCATRPFLRLAGFDREWKGVSPSSAGNGPRYLFLKATKPYVIDPNQRVWAAFGTSTHEKLSIHEYTKDVLSEEKLSDGNMAGIADCLDQSESREGWYDLTDYKTFGSFKVAKILGIISESIEETVLGPDKKPVILKSGPNMGKPKTKKRTEITTDSSKADMKAEELQLNRYRIFFESYGFPIDKIQIQVVSRDGGTYIAQNRGIEKNLYMILVKRLENKKVILFYKELADEVLQAYKCNYVRRCDSWESWERRRCDEKWCEVINDCKAMSKKACEKWGIL